MSAGEGLGGRASYVWDEIRQGSNYEDEWFQEGSVTVVDVSGNTKTGRQTCRYFGNEFYEVNIAWPAPLKTPAPTDVPALTPSPLPSSDRCDSAMKAASEVPLDRNNETELDMAALSCSSVDSWVAALRKYPDAIGLLDLSAEDIATVLVLTCNRAPTTDLCADAAARGLWEK